MERESQLFKENGNLVVEWVSAYWNSLHRGRGVEPPFSNPRPGDLFSHLSLTSPNPPSAPEAFDTVMTDFNQLVLPKTVNWMSSHFHAYFPCGNSAASLTADMISGAINAIGFSWVSNPSGTELEMFVVDWLAQMISLPREFHFASNSSGGGTIVGSASEATLMALLAAREKVILQRPSENPFVLMSKMIGYTSKEAHSSVRRAGLLSRLTIRLVPLERSTHRMDSNALCRMILHDIEKGFIPMYVCATLGTTGVCAFDDLAAIGPLCCKFKMWLHVDAAYGGNALICPEYQHFLEGVECVDSLVISPHKWMMVNYDCSVMWFRNRQEFATPFLVEPEYLRRTGSSHDDAIPDFRHYGIPCGRRFRALKLWFVVRMYGVVGLQENIRRQVQHGCQLLELLSKSPQFHVVGCSMGVVCFRLKGRNVLTENLLHAVNATGKIRLIHTKIGGKFVIRFVASGTRSDEANVKFAWDTIQDCADKCLAIEAKADSEASPKSAEGRRRIARHCSFPKTLTTPTNSGEDSDDVFYTDDDD